MTHSPIIPAIIPQSKEHLFESLARVRGVASSVQIDVLDGVFTPNASWPYGEGDASGAAKEISAETSLFAIEIDLMVLRPEEHLDHWSEAGVKRIVVHLESTKHIESIIMHADTHAYELGIAFDDDTPVSEVSPFVERVAFVQCMGIDHISVQGEPFEPRVLKNLKSLRTQFPNAVLSVDGSVNKHTIALLKEAGANRFVAGSALFGSGDIVSAYEELNTLL